MPTEVILPKVDMDMATGRISQWFRREGDVVRKGEPLFEIETDKAAMEIEAPASGTLRDISGAEGVDIEVGVAVAWIYAEGEEARTAPAGMPASDASEPGEASPDAKPVDEGAALALIEGEGTKPSEAVDATRSSAVDGLGERRPVRATPLARRLARKLSVDLSGLAGRGPHGRIQREDVEEAANTRPSAAAPEAKVASEAPDRPVPARGLVPATTADEAPLHVVQLRPGEGTPLVLIHGFGAESASWRPFLAEVPAGLPVYGVDLPGHGGSVTSEAAGLDAMARDVERTLAAHGVGAAHLVGHSLGAAVAVVVAGGVAVEALSLLLLAPAGLGPDIDTGFIEGFAAATEEPAIETWLRHLVADASALPDGLVRATARARADGRHAAAQAPLASTLFSRGTQLFEVRGLLDRLTMPVKVVMGTDDRIVPSRHARGLPGRVALHLFARTGHMPQIERRAEVGGLLRELVR